MNYATIKFYDVANGTGVRVSLFVSGCRHHCKGCFNAETWDFSYGEPYTQETEDSIIDGLKPDYITGLSLLGGEPFEPENQPALTALLLDGVSGGLAGAIGLALADILAGDPGYAITTFVLKFIIGITCGAVAHKVFKLRDRNAHEKGYLVKVIVAAGSGLFLNVLTDPFLGYFRNVFIFGQEYTVAQALSKIAGGVTLVNSVASTVCVVILYLALRPALERAKLLTKGETK